MTTYRIAHIREQGHDMIIIPLEDRFEHATQADKNALLTHLQACATTAGLAGTVVLMWAYAHQTKFIAPPQWHPFFRNLPLAAAYQSLNKELHCA
jgi:hypothetical protein